MAEKKETGALVCQKRSACLTPSGKQAPWLHQLIIPSLSPSRPSRPSRLHLSNDPPIRVVGWHDERVQGTTIRRLSKPGFGCNSCARPLNQRVLTPPTAASFGSDMAIVCAAVQNDDFTPRKALFWKEYGIHIWTHGGGA
ncbi:hypothetical protein GLAREA_07593 [Glarea lozoyensis ATCC 20868]|uniref:Uncharacterized protein n=1 Tax=Glarea lozoyensis (strain ATCC 20868 / MF5171) TaxID=1116229 RepID=S3D3T5_GLAL2|nr:uncharacterized protein GLAREA_07593 [Glarea lozoyensis ATCC 20868]EPE32460.1 hypothetical protein GLAREA_07593 [Glarea lozoyensis ATCC 20868]